MNDETITETTFLVNSDVRSPTYCSNEHPTEQNLENGQKKLCTTKRVIIFLFICIIVAGVGTAVVLLTKYVESQNSHAQNASKAFPITEEFVCSFKDKTQPFKNVTGFSIVSTTRIDDQVRLHRFQAEQPLQRLQQNSVPYCDKHEPARVPVVGIIQADVKASGSDGDVDVTIPLSTPHGAGGHNPNLALKYNANAGDSVLGKGWGMAFLPSISRCPKTWEQNGYSQGITLTEKDAFCSGSDQLVLVRGQTPDSQNYQGEIYQTARYSKILYKAYGPRNGFGPIYWTAHLPNGIKREFGVTADSRIMAANGAVFIWQASSVSDPFDNPINMEYQQSTDGSADWYRTAIKYAEGNAKVEFTYIPRSDETEGYVSGIPLRTTKLLSAITSYSTIPQQNSDDFPVQSVNEMSSGNSSSQNLIPIFKYYFNYEQSPVSGRSLLSSLQLCDGCDTVCQLPIKFSYDGGLGISPLQNDTLKTNSMTVPSSWYYEVNCQESKGTKLFYPTLTKRLTVDVNGDAKADVVVTTWNANGFLMQTYLSNGDGSFKPAIQIDLISSGTEWTEFYHFMSVVVDEKNATFSVFMNDFSGDGIPDVMAVLIVDSKAKPQWRPTIDGSEVYITTVTAKGRGGGFYDAVQYSHVNQAIDFLGNASALKCDVILQDVIPDFKLDLLIACGGSNGWKVMTAMGDGNGFFINRTNMISHLDSIIGSADKYELLYQDVTGDGSPDLIAVYAGPRGIMTFVSKSQRNGLYEPLKQQILSSDNVGTEGNHSIQIANLGGGTLDLVVSSIDNTGWSAWISRSTGDGKFTPAISKVISVLPFGWGSEVAQQYIFDMNGDGRGDFVAIRTPGKQQDRFLVYVAYSLPKKFEFSSLEEIRLSSGVESASSTDVNEPFVADVTGDGRVDIGAFHLHFYTCKNDPFYSKLYVVPSQGRSPLDKLTKLQNGFGSWTSLKYEPMTSLSVYSKTPAHGVSVVKGPYVALPVSHRYLVQSIDHDDGSGGTSSVTHFYAGFAVHTRGYGSLGFAQITSTQSVTGISQTTDFSQDFTRRKKRLPERLRTFSQSGVLLGDQNNTWSVKDIQLQPITTDAILAYEVVQQSQVSNSETGQLVRSERRETAFDGFGNPIDTNYTSSDVYGIYEKTTTTKYRNDASKWLIGLPEEIIETSQVAWENLPNDLLVSSHRHTDRTGRQWIVYKKEAKRTFDIETGTITSETLLAGTPYEIVTTSTRDSRGNVVRVESLASGESKPQIVNMGYDTSGRFQVKYCDVIGFCQYWAHGAAGQILRETGDSGDIIIHQYDTLMRELQAVSSQGQGVNTSLMYCDSHLATQYNNKPLANTVSCAAFSNAVYVKVIQPIIGPPSYQYFDRHGRRVGVSKTLKNDNQIITESTEYDKFGKPKTLSLPHTTTTESVITLDYGRDEYGRVVSVTNSLFPSRKVNIQTVGSNITFIDPLGRKKKHVTNAADLVVEVVGEMQEQLRYWYDPDGNLLGVQGHINDKDFDWLLRTAYDEGGYKQAIIHPDRGRCKDGNTNCVRYEYGHDSRGRLIWQKDPNGNNVTFEWDARGRAMAAHSAEGSHYYNYSKQFPDKLVAEYSVNSDVKYCLNYTYDLKGLLIQVDKKFQLPELDLPKSSANGCWYNSTLKYDYDSTGRLTRIVYPTGFSFTPMYDDNNRVTKVVDMMGRVQWQALEFNSNGQVTKEQRGNGLVTEYGYDALSHTLLSIRTYGNKVTVQDIKYTLDDAENVIERVDGTKGLQESFEYDELNRIIKASLQGSGTPFVQEFRYDDNSNLIYKSDVGEFHYSSDHPHAIKQVRKSSNTSLLYEFEYDANGNRVSGNGTSIRYNSMNKPVNITRGPFTTIFDYTLTGKLIGRRDRVRLNVTQEGNSSNVTLRTYRTTMYVDDLYHEETTRDPVLKPSTVQKHYIETYAVVVRIINGTVKVVNDSHGNVTDIRGGYDQLYVVYPYTDVKGSLSLVTDESGKVVQEYSFDVCGSPRSPLTWLPLKRRDETVQNVTFLSLDEANNLLSRYQHTDQQGYDGHEQLLDIGGDLIHMQGRLYDSTHCTFSTPDPTNDNSYSLVGYNSYAYGRFNPLSGSDPSGYGFLSWLGHLFSSLFHLLAHIAEEIGKFIVHIIDDVVKFLRKFPILDDILTAVIDEIAEMTGNLWIEFVWTIINGKIMGESWGDILKDGIINLATTGVGSILKGAKSAAEFLGAAAEGAEVAVHAEEDALKTALKVVTDVAKKVAGRIIKRKLSNVFTCSYNNIPYLMLDIHGLTTKAVEGAINAAALDAIKGHFGDISKDTLQGAWKVFRNAIVQKLDKQTNRHNFLTAINKWGTRKVPLINNAGHEFEKMTTFFGGSKRPDYYAQATIDVRTDIDRTILGFDRHFTVTFNAHTHAVYFQSQASADFFFMHKAQLMHLQIRVHAEAPETWKRHL
ncbi:uncharacterized protein LOC134180805 [Corticium candelabrum]|uniref:uncharacterized protein LOC134180805 n=1 Tax=Corticium candelabrum TaxID=121492 RepID=UPI002E254270|nr:uncharacterized protein LOC134180805 [Corticium candelabrum]